jgi:glycosyltransferase involved in cell wall biosynthesis
MKTILATAYAINPYKGSEDGMGWNFVMQIARFNRVIAITRENNRPHIEKFMAENPDELYSNVQFLFYDLPLWMRFWKKGSRGAMLYYQMWQWGMISFIKNQQLEYDIVHNLNFHNNWTPSFLWKLNKPFVWGPVGHHPLIPAQYLQPYARTYKIKDRLTWLVKQYFWKLSPSLQRSTLKADHILCMNKAVPGVLKIRNKHSIMPSVATEDLGFTKNKVLGDTFTLISAGRLVPLKGFDLTIRSFAAFAKSQELQDQEACKLIIVGSGPEEVFLKTLSRDLQVEKQVHFISWIERADLLNLFKEASAFIFPSHEGAGMVVAEALSFGLPVICLDNEGPGQFINPSCGYAIPQGDYNTTVAGLTDAIQDLYSFPEKRTQLSEAARKHFEAFFHWDRRGEQLQKIYAGL